MGRFSFLRYPEKTTVWNKRDLTQPLGKWGPTTASIDWCELNYAITPWIAEVLNTATNVVFVALAIHTILASIDQKFPTRIIIASAGVVLVGVGSALFHATLMFEWQILDELPMIFCTANLLFIVADTSSPVWQQCNLMYPVAVIAYDVAFTFAYLTFPNPVFHQVCYASMTAMAIYRIVVLLYTKIPGTEANLESRRLLTNAVGLGALAFFIWNLDNLFCHRVDSFKSTLPLALSFLFEGHAWWHILMGFSVNNLNLAIAYLTLSIRDSPDHYRLKRQFGGLIKVLERTEKGWKALEEQERKKSQ